MILKTEKKKSLNKRKKSFNMYLTFEGELLDTLCVLANWYDPKIRIDSYRHIIENILHLIDAKDIESSSVSMASNMIQTGIIIEDIKILEKAPDKRVVLSLTEVGDLRLFRCTGGKTYRIIVPARNMYKYSSAVIYHKNPLIKLFNALSGLSSSVVEKSIAYAMSFANNEVMRYRKNNDDNVIVFKL